jgi:pimeloyl-ACP methyl ester carboxylesterase
MKNLNQISNLIRTGVLLLAICITTVGIAQQPATTLKSSGLAPVNGLKVYYEVHGDGRPLVLLHGAFMTIEMNWGQLIPDLAKTHKVIAIEMQGHGHTADTKRPFSYEALADDVADVMKYLKIEKADIVGYSFGGTVAYQLAIQNQEMVNSLTIISSTYKAEGWQPEALEALKSIKPEFFDDSPLKSGYVAVAPDPGHWIEFVSKLLDFDTVHYNLGDEHIKSISCPVLLICGDNDGIDKPELIKTYQLLGGAVFGDMVGMPKSHLAILPAKGHVSLMMDTPAIFSLLDNFYKTTNP